MHIVGLLPLQTPTVDQTQYRHLLKEVVCVSGLVLLKPRLLRVSCTQRCEQVERANNGLWDTLEVVGSL